VQRTLHMTQRKSSEDRARARAIGRRIRSIRGQKSQQEFAEALGLSRSGLANYELGRSTPPAQIIEKIQKNLGVSVDMPPELEDFEAEFNELVGDGKELTEDEWSLIRTLRLADTQDVQAFVLELVKRVEERSAGLRFGNPETTALDLARLITIAMGKRPFLAGSSGEQAVRLARALANIVER